MNVSQSKDRFVKYSLKIKLVTSISLLLLIGVTVGVGAQWSIRSLSDSVHKLSISAASADWLAQASMAKPELIQNLWVAAFDYDLGKKASDSVLKEVATSVRTFKDAKNKYAVETQLSPEEKILYDKIEGAWGPIEKKIGDITQSLKEAKVKRDVIAPQISSLSDSALALSDALSELGTLVKQRGTDAEAQSAEVQKKSTLFSIIAAAMGLAIAFFTLALVSKVAKSLENLAARLVTESTEVESASTTIVSTANKLSAGATQQSAAAQQTVASLEEMSSMINKNAESSKDSGNKSELCSRTAEEGKQEVAKVIVSMSEINHGNGELVARVEQSNQEISEIVQVVNEIGVKTKVLTGAIHSTYFY